MYFFVIVFAAIYWIIYGNWIGGCLMASLFLVLFYSIWYCKKERKQINFKIKANDWVVTQGEEFKIFLEVSGSSLWMDDHLFEIEYEVETKLHGTKEQKKCNFLHKSCIFTYIFLQISPHYLRTKIFLTSPLA